MPILLFTITDPALVSAVGAIIVALAGYIIVRDKIHRKDMKERNALLEKQFTTLTEISETAQENIKENTDVLSALKTLLEINLRR